MSETLSPTQKECINLGLPLEILEIEDSAEMIDLAISMGL